MTAAQRGSKEARTRHCPHAEVCWRRRKLLSIVAQLDRERFLEICRLEEEVDEVLLVKADCCYH